MKLRRFLFSILLLCCSLLIKAQHTRADTIKMICQTWKIKSLDKTPVDEETKEEWIEMIEDSRTEFRSDMTVIGYSDENSEKGKWSLDKSCKVITLTYGEGETIKWIILSLSATEFHFKEPDPDPKKSISGILVPVKK